MWKVVIKKPGSPPLEFSPLPLVSPLELPPAALDAGAGEAGAWAAVSAPAQPAPLPTGAAPAPRRLLSGRVIDAGSRKPIPGALVWATADPGAFVRTDGEGLFQLSVPARRRFETAIAAAGFLPRKAAPPGPQLASRKSATFALDRAGALRGKVVDPQGRPVAGAAVVAIPAGARGERAFAPTDPVAERTVTDPQGFFALRVLRPAQAYEIRATRAGAFPAAQRATVGDAADPARNVTLVLAPARAVRGKVQDREGKPIADAEAVLRPALRPGVVPSGEEAEGMLSRSDAKGLFSLTEAPAAEVELTVRKKGYATVVLPALRIPAGNGPADLGVVTLRPGARLAGRVIDRRGQAVAGAEIFRLPGPVDPIDMERALKKRKPAVAAGADGRFLLEDLAQAVPIHLAVRAEGFLTALARDIRPPTAQPLTIRLEPAAVLRGRVVDEAGKPVPGARIDLRWEAYLPEEPDRPVGEPILRNARAEADGRFELREIPAGTARVSAGAPGFVTLDPIAVELPRPAQAGDLKLVLTRGATLQGRVTTAAGDPVAAVRVGVGGASATTNDDGLYWLEGAELGPQEVIFLHASYGRLVKKRAIQPGVNQLDVVFDAGVEVTGRAVDESGSPVSGARVELASENRFDLKQAHDVTGDDGRFRLAPVLPGRYRLKAAADGFSDTTLPKTVEVAAEPVANLEITLEKGAALSGKILGLPPEDLSQVTVEARGERGDTVAAWTDGRGRYEIRSLYPGDWLVQATLWDGQRQAQARLAIRRSDREVTRDLEFTPRLTLSLQVLADEEPLPDAQVTLRGQRFAAERAATTDLDGRARLDDLEPDTYRLGVRHTRSLLLHNDQIDLQQDRDLVIRLQSATLGGLVESAEHGDPIADALLALHPLEGPDYLITANTKADGRFIIHHVQPGRYRLDIRARGFAPAEQELQLAGGETIDDLDLRLKPTPGAHLQVRLASGQTPEFIHLQVRDSAGQTVLAETRHRNDAGLFDLSMLSPGAWTLYVRADGGALATAALIVPTAEPLALTLAPAGKLSLRIPALVTSDRTGTVRLLGNDQKPFWTIGPGGNVLQQWPLTGGKAVIDGLPAGAWVIQVEASDGQKWQGAAVTAGADAAVVIE
jgi:protocatechuate 3,4-dioxygenase beta subunit